MVMSEKQSKTAGIIIIGNEILSGKVRDTNSYYLASELRGLGVSVLQIAVIPDDIEAIAEAAKGFSSQYDYVFTSGGVGPTHDDVTMAGIAHGFGLRLVQHPGFIDFFKSRYGNDLNDAVLKMAEIPEGAEIIGMEDARFPAVVYRNIYIFPGIPQYLIDKFSSMKERFRSSAFYLKRFFLNANESDIAGILNAVVAENKDVDFGSYPVIGNPEYKVVITAESKSERALEKAVQELSSSIPGHMLVRTG